MCKENKTYVVSEEWNMSGDSDDRIVGVRHNFNDAEKLMQEAKKELMDDWNITDLSGWVIESDTPTCFEIHDPFYKYQYAVSIKEIPGTL